MDTHHVRGTKGSRVPKSEEPVLGKAAIGAYYKKLFANPQFVPFTLTLNWNSFHLAGDIAIATALLEGDVTRIRSLPLALRYPRGGSDQRLRARRRAGRNLLHRARYDLRCGYCFYRERQNAE